MIVCKSCGFNINGNMKFAIKSNKCPCCGKDLFENEELRQIKKISSELLNNGFKFKQELMRNLSIFIMNKISSLSPKIEEFGEQDIFEEDVIEDSDFSNHQLGRETGYDESEETFQEETFQEDSLSDEEDRVDRLRRMAKENAILNKRGAAVRRIGD